ncbi:MAG: hypothetical protein ACOX22_11175 [Caldicoprobacterales bacterium]
MPMLHMTPRHWLNALKRPLQVLLRHKTGSKVTKGVRPANDHPWRQSPDKKPTLSYAETDTEIIEMLNDLFSSTRAWA